MEGGPNLQVRVYGLGNGKTGGAGGSCHWLSTLYFLSLSNSGVMEYTKEKQIQPFKLV